MAVALLMPLSQAVTAQVGFTETADAAPTDPEVDALIRVLEDPAQRARLVEALRSEAPPTPEEAGTAAPDTMPITSLAADFALRTRDVTHNLASGASAVARDVGRLSMLPQLLTPARQARIASEAPQLVFTAVTTLLIVLMLRALSRRMLRATRDRDSLVDQIIGLVLQVGLRIVAVVAAWLIGYGLAQNVLADGEMLLSQALYLNAFLIVGLVSVALSVFASNDPRDYTFAKLPIAAERTVYVTLQRTIAVLIYGLVAVVPIAQDWVNFVLARSLRTVVVTLAALMAIYAIYRIASVLRREASRQPVDVAADNSIAGTLAISGLGFWDRTWPTLGVLYVLVSYSVAIASPNLMVELVGRATAFTAVGVAGLLVATRMLSLVGAAPKLPMPDALIRALPSLQDRISGFLPAVLLVGGLAILAGSVAIALEGWRIIDLTTWGAAGGTALIWRLVNLALLVVALIVAWSVLSAWVDSRLATDNPDQQISARSRTLLALFRNAISIALVVFGGMTVLSELGIDIAPLLAGAGVIGLAIGFGAQKLVQDIITGIFIQLENAINEGDVITVSGISGVVEKLTIRSVALRDLHGAYHLIPFSSVDSVTNFMRRFGYHVEVVGVAYDSDLEVVEQAMRTAFEAVLQDPLGADITDPLEWHGVVSLGDSAVNLRARIKTRPGKQWGIGRAYTAQVKKALDAAGVEIPFPHRELKLPPKLLDALTSDARGARPRRPLPRKG